MWFFFSQIQLLSHRYLKSYLWPYAFYIHAITGTVMYLLTLFMAVFALNKLGFLMIKNVHYWFVFPVFNLTLFIVGFGYYAKRLGTKSEWNTRTYLRWRFVHQYLGFKFIMVAQGALTSGIYYYRINPKHYTDTPLEWIQLGVFFGMIGMQEIIYQIMKRKEIAFRPTNVSAL